MFDEIHHDTCISPVSSGSGAWTQRRPLWSTQYPRTSHSPTCCVTRVERKGVRLSTYGGLHTGRRLALARRLVDSSVYDRRVDNESR